MRASERAAIESLLRMIAEATDIVYASVRQHEPVSAVESLQKLEWIFDSDRRREAEQAARLVMAEDLVDFSVIHLTTDQFEEAEVKRIAELIVAHQYSVLELRTDVEVSNTLSHVYRIARAMVDQQKRQNSK